MNRKLKRIILSILPFVGAILYRLGGMAGMNTKFRDLGVPTVGLAVMLLLGVKVAWWVHLIAFGLLFGALTTYWDSLFGYDNFYFHGFMCAFAYLPYAIATHLWVAFIIRCIICSVFMGLLNYFANKYNWKHSDWIEELGRGGALIGTLFLFKPPL